MLRTSLLNVAPLHSSDLSPAATMHQVGNCTAWRWGLTRAPVEQWTFQLSPCPIFSASSWSVKWLREFGKQRFRHVCGGSGGHLSIKSKTSPQRNKQRESTVSLESRLTLNVMPSTSQDLGVLVLPPIRALWSFWISASSYVTWGWL